MEQDLDLPTVSAALVVKLSVVNTTNSQSIWSIGDWLRVEPRGSTTISNTDYDFSPGTQDTEHIGCVTCVVNGPATIRFIGASNTNIRNCTLTPLIMWNADFDNMAKECHMRDIPRVSIKGTFVKPCKDTCNVWRVKDCPLSTAWFGSEGKFLSALQAEIPVINTFPHQSSAVTSSGTTWSWHVPSRASPAFLLVTLQLDDVTVTNWQTDALRMSTAHPDFNYYVWNTDGSSTDALWIVG